ncbi:ABC transporter ATP-binding protein [Paenibacillus xylanexedens]|uniref:ABC transporter ATP-binding protein n=1 Tax=Paenibacillus xylanexedens TaxID=528191 RepID=UPI000FB20BEB|nr:ABC transporter ATP-binding protein [Paenibacillus xylanexedens]RPK27801.1 hypothetical protein EDO6_03324 [Paenibacillus xylanexedens]
MGQTTLEINTEHVTTRKSNLYKIYAWSLSFLKPYKKKFIISFLLGLIISIAQISIPKFVQLLIDEILPSNNRLRYWNSLGTLLLIIILVIASTIIKYMIDRNVQECVARDMQLGVFRKIRSLGYSFYERYPVGEVLSLFHLEVEAIQKIIRQYFPTILQFTITFVVTFSFMAHLSWQLSFIFVPGILIYYLFGPYFERKSAQYAQQLEHAHSELNKNQYDSISSLIEIRTYGQETWDLNRLLDRDRKTAAINVIFFKLINYRGAFRRVAVYFSGVLMFVFGYFFIIKDLLTIGEFIAFTILYYKVMFDLTILITNITEQKELLYQTVKLHQFMELQPEIIEVQNPVLLSTVKGKIEFENVSFGYSSSSLIVKDINLTIEAGEKVAFVGMSGNGKSSLIKLVSRFYDPTEGEVRLDNINLSVLSLSQLRENIGYVFQETYLYGSSIKENIRFGKSDVTDEDIVNASKLASAHAFISEFPDSYDTIVGERGNRLSGGQRQRIAIARLILQNPSIIILDEATSALDQENEDKVKRALDHQFQGKTILAVAHRISTIQDYDKIVLIEDGKISEVGTYEKLLEKKGAFYELLMGEKKDASVTSMDH